MAVAAVLSLYSLRPPAPVPASAPSNEFSADRAVDYIRPIAAGPRPTGSPANAAAREYILSAFRRRGLDPQVQETIGIRQTGRYAPAAFVRNVLARLRGRETGKAVLLVGHYDSTPNGPGAADDGQSVGVLLETLRALRAGPALRNDVIFLLTDGEELGLLGAAAFVNEHPWAKDVGVALNFEARGTGGPVHMFETSEQNGWLIRQFVQAAPYPRTDSISYEIYRRLPNDTDLTVFKRHGYAGLNFAFIEDVFFYHTPFDDLAHLDRGSVQQQGSYALSLARQFGNADLSQTRADDAVFFTAPGRKVMVYSQALVWPLALATSLLLAALIAAGLRRRSLAPMALARGLLAFLLAMVAAPAAVWALWQVIVRLQPPPAVTYIQPYNWRWYEFAFIALTLAIVIAIYTVFLRRTSVADLTASGLLVWMILMLVACNLAPLTSYIFTWPLLLALPAFWALLARPRWLTVWLCLSVVVAAWLVTPYIDLLFVSLTVGAGALAMLLLALLLGLLLPAWLFLCSVRLVLGAALACLLLLVAASLTSGFTPEHPKPATVAYSLDSATGKAVWITDALTPDPWSAQFVNNGSGRGPLPSFISAKTVRQGFAPALPLPAPEIETVDDKAMGGVRSLTLRVRSPRQAQGLVILFNTDTVRGLSVNDHAPGVKPALPIRLFTFVGMPPEGIQLRLSLKPGGPLRLRVFDCSGGTPGTHQPRPANVMRSIAFWPYNETTLVGRDFEIRR